MCTLLHTLSVSPQKSLQKTQMNQEFWNFIISVHYKYSQCGKADWTKYGPEEAMLRRHIAASRKAPPGRTQQYLAEDGTTQCFLITVIFRFLKISYFCLEIYD